MTPAIKLSGVRGSTTSMGDVTDDEHVSVVKPPFLYLVPLLACRAVDTVYANYQGLCNVCACCINLGIITG